MTIEPKDPAEVLMDIDHLQGTLDTALFYSKQLELTLHQIAARLGVEPVALLDGSAMELIPDRRVLS